MVLLHHCSRVAKPQKKLPLSNTSRSLWKGIAIRPSSRSAQPGQLRQQSGHLSIHQLHLPRLGLVDLRLLSRLLHRRYRTRQLVPPLSPICHRCPVNQVNQWKQASLHQPVSHLSQCSRPRLQLRLKQLIQHYQGRLLSLFLRHLLISPLRQRQCRS